jgi:hypothetical protein
MLQQRDNQQIGHGQPLQGVSAGHLLVVPQAQAAVETV